LPFTAIYVCNNSCEVREERNLYAAVEFQSAELQQLCKALADVNGMKEHAASIRTGGKYGLTLADGPQGRSVQ
jgi:hypothetical protein